MHTLLEYIHQKKQSLYTADWGLARTKAFLQLLGNPQHSFTPIHVAGTSGKTSTSVMIAQLLLAQGESVGLTISPHIFSETERLWVNGFNPTEEEFDTLMNSLKHPLYVMEAGEFGIPTYFEFLICAAFVWFAEKKVTYAVVEVGLGGLFDSTNVLNQAEKIAVISSVGFDHQAILGNTIAEIAAQKAGIIHRGNNVVTLQQNSEIMGQINQRITQVGAFTPRIIDPKNPNYNIQIDSNGCSFTWENEEFFLNMKGQKQAENALLALTTLYEVNKGSISKTTIEKYKKVFKNITVPARVEEIVIKLPNEKTKTILLDGAHNVEKIRNITNVLHLYVQGRVDVLIAVKKDKAVEEMVSELFSAPQVVWGQVYATEFDIHQDLPHSSIYSSELAEIIQTKTSILQTNIRILPKLNKVIFSEICHSNTSRTLLIIGSLYLASEVKKLIKLEI